MQFLISALKITCSRTSDKHVRLSEHQFPHKVSTLGIPALCLQCWAAAAACTD